MALRGYGQMVRDAREARGWTQSELGDRVSVSFSTISNIEREETTPSIEQANDLIAALGLSGDDFFRAMGANLHPPAVAKLPRSLLLALLDLRDRPDDLVVVERVALGLLIAPASRQ